MWSGWEEVKGKRLNGFKGGCKDRRGCRDGRVKRGGRMEEGVGMIGWKGGRGGRNRVGMVG